MGAAEDGVVGGRGDILVVNAGSTSLKLHLVDAGDTSRPLDTLAQAAGLGIQAVAHRVVHGGSRFREPVVVDAEVMAAIKALATIAPLHNLPALEGIEKARCALSSQLPHVAVFDTAFHATLPPASATYALPREWRESWGVRRYGFHGLSVAWAVERAAVLVGGPVERMVICHLGGGSSLTAVRDGRSVDTTMGFSPLEGPPMTTRSGSLDPGALLYLMRERALEAAAVEGVLNQESGLLALGGHGGDMRALERAAAGGDPEAGLALEVFLHRLAGAAASMAAAAGGLDVLVFTAGIGENSAFVREGLCSRLSFLGVEIDRQRNAGAEPDTDVTGGRSRVRVLVIRAHEEIVAARAARSLIASD
jgi:acetate kinase